jgi:hypothetical protein
MTNNVEALFFRDFTYGKCALKVRPVVSIRTTSIAKHDATFTVRLERVRDIDGISLLVTHRGTIDMSLARLDRPTVDDDRRAIVSHRGDRATRHVLVASR